MPLTDAAARNAKPAAKTVRMFDRDGLYLEVSPRGGKWWRLKYRYAGKEKRVSLGVYPEVNLKRARARTIDARQLLAEGVDPSENRRAAKAAQVEGAANSFEVVTREWIDNQMKSWVRGHGERILTRFECDIFPWIGARPIADLTAPENDAGLGGLLGHAQERRRRDSDSQGRLTALSTASQSPERRQKSAVAFGQLRRILFMCRKTRL